MGAGERFTIVRTLGAGFSPRTESLLFNFFWPKQMMVVSGVEFYADFKNPFLTKIRFELLTQYSFKVGHPPSKLSLIRGENISHI